MANYEATRYNFDGANLSDVEGVNTGIVIPWSSASVPSGFLECDGSAVSRTTYSALFAVVGTTWGSGDGSTTFNLPDLRGEFVRGWDNSRGVDSSRSFASSQGHQLQEHTHTITANEQNVGDPPNPITIKHIRSGGNNGATQDSGDTGYFGSETRPRNIAMMYVIKT